MNAGYRDEHTFPSRGDGTKKHDPERMLDVVVDYFVRGTLQVEIGKTNSAWDSEKEWVVAMNDLSTDEQHEYKGYDDENDAKRVFLQLKAGTITAYEVLVGEVASTARRVRDAPCR